MGTAKQMGTYQAWTHPATSAVLRGRSRRQTHTRGGRPLGEDQEWRWGLSRGAGTADRRFRQGMRRRPDRRRSREARRFGWHGQSSLVSST